MALSKLPNFAPLDIYKFILSSVMPNSKLSQKNKQTTLFFFSFFLFFLNIFLYGFQIL